MRGRDKLLERIDGESLIRRAASEAARSVASAVVVVVGHDHGRRMAELSGLDVEIVATELAAEGMAGSIRAGIAHLGDDCDGAMLILPDMPCVGAEEINAIASQSGADEIVRATSGDGTPGHPVYFPRKYFPDLIGLTGDSGARPVLSRYSENVRYIRLPGNKAVLDLDTPEDWEAWIDRRR